MRQINALAFPEDPSAFARGLIFQLHEARHDYEAFVSFFCEDCAFRIVGQVPEYPFSALYVGKSGVRALLRRMDDQVELSNGRILNLLVDGDRIAVRRSIVVRHHGTAASMCLMVANLIRLRGDKVLEIFEYLDTNWLRRLSGET